MREQFMITYRIHTTPMIISNDLDTAIDWKEMKESVHNSIFAQKAFDPYCGAELFSGADVVASVKLMLSSETKEISLSSILLL